MSDWIVEILHAYPPLVVFLALVMSFVIGPPRLRPVNTRYPQAADDRKLRARAVQPE